ncbi:hypothetical protein OL548_19175 [Lysinibacillus sp. MHQ-1]|nr:hypothetical protein OL548_19175 [Lysinibacillus sp. MHQ-1]
MSIKHIQSQLAKQATIFQTGGFRPTHELLESWIGYVGWSLLEEDRPSNFQPLATLFFERFALCSSCFTAISIGNAICP